MSMLSRAALVVIVGTVLSQCSRAEDASQSYQVVDDAIPVALTDLPGRPEAGRDVFLDRERGHCLLCHRVAPLRDPFQGTIGPDLSMIGSVLSKDQLRLRVVDQAALNPETVMPSYFKVSGLHQVGTAFAGKPVLTAQEVEDVVAYLASLKE